MHLRGRRLRLGPSRPLASSGDGPKPPRPGPGRAARPFIAASRIANEAGALLKVVFIVCVSETPVLMMP